MVERTDSKVKEQPIEHSTWNCMTGVWAAATARVLSVCATLTPVTRVSRTRTILQYDLKKKQHIKFVNYKASTMTGASNLYLWLWKQNNCSLIFVDIDTETQNAPFWVSVRHSCGASRSTTRVSIGFQINFHWLLDICLGLRQCE